VNDVIGLDTSLTATGIASSSGWCTRIGRSGVTTMPLAERLAVLDELVGAIVDKAAQAQLVVIEQPAFSRSGGGAVERHALFWLVVRDLHRRGIPVAEVSATTRIRYALGKGTGSKSAVVDAVARRWPQFATGGDDNLADAVVLAAMGSEHLGKPLTALPAANRAAVEAVRWPEVTAAVDATPAPAATHSRTHWGECAYMHPQCDGQPQLDLAVAGGH
jgi:crossover junction endodeoxyribonuclease RuvC